MRRAQLRAKGGDSAADDNAKSKGARRWSPTLVLAASFVLGMTLTGAVAAIIRSSRGKAPEGPDHSERLAASPAPLASQAPIPAHDLVLGRDEVLVVAEEDEPGSLEKALRVLKDPNARPPEGATLRMPAGVGEALDKIATSLEPRVARLLLEGRGDTEGHSAHGAHEAGEGGVADDDATLERAGLLPDTEPGVWETAMVETFAADWPTDSLWYPELLTIMRAVRVSRLLRGGLTDEEAVDALNRPVGAKAEARSRALRQRARGAAVLSFGMFEDMLLWAEANPGGLVVALAAEQWWNDGDAKASQEFMGACEEAKVCCAVVRVPWPTTMEKDDLPQNVGKPHMVLSGVVEAAKDGFKNLHVGGKQAEAECMAWTSGEAATLPWTFDVVLIRSPHAYNKRSPGRMASIATAAELAAPGAHIFVRDIARASELRWTAGYFGAPPAAAMPKKGEMAVQTTTDTDGVVVVRRSPGVPKSVPETGDPDAKWTAKGLAVFAGTPDEQAARGSHRFLAMVDKTAHFRTPGRVKRTARAE